MRPDPHPGDINRNDYCAPCLAKNRAADRESCVVRLPGGLAGSYRWAAVQVHATRVAEQARAIRGLDDLVLSVAEERVADAAELRDRIPTEVVEQLEVSGAWSAQMDVLAQMIHGLEQNGATAIGQWQIADARTYITAMRCVLDAQEHLERDEDVPEGADFLVAFEVESLSGLMLDGFALGRHDVAITALDSLATSLPALRARIEASARTPLRAVAA